MTVIAHRCAVLGKPIAHSLSPVLHNAAYKALGLDGWAYERHEVGESDLDGFFKRLDPTWRGLSLTMPLKKTIQPYGAPSNMWAQRLKVANTAIFDWPAEPGITPGVTPDGTSATGSLPAIRLYNTDVMGIVLAFDHELKALGEPDRWKSATSAAVIGNGNTAASAVPPFVDSGLGGDISGLRPEQVARVPQQRSPVPVHFGDRIRSVRLPAQRIGRFSPHFG